MPSSCNALPSPKDAVLTCATLARVTPTASSSSAETRTQADAVSRLLAVPTAEERFTGR